jgi:hypothetical protein
LSYDLEFLERHQAKHAGSEHVQKNMALVYSIIGKPITEASRILKAANNAANAASTENAEVFQPSGESRDTFTPRTTRRVKKTYAARKIPTLEELKAKFALLENRIKPDSKEHNHQTLVKLWCRIQALENPALECLAWIHAVPNAARRSPQLAAQMIEEGLESGVPDLFLDEPRGVFHGLRIEMKRKGGRVSDTQELWLKHLMERGYFAVVCTGWLEARDTILWYLEEVK